MLSFLLWFQIQSCESAQILFAHSFVNSGSPSNPFPIIVSCIGPPVCFRFDIPDDHVFDLHRQPGNLPGNVGFPAAPRLTQMLQYSFSFVSFDPLRHHIWDVFDHGRSQLEVILALNALFCYWLRNSFRMTPFKLACEQVTQPAFEKWNDSTNEKEPNTPSRSPKANPRPLSNLARVESIIKQMLDVLGHSYLSH